MASTTNVKTRSDFFLEEDYNSYQAMSELTAALLSSPLPLMTAMALSKLIENARQSAYSAGYANAELDAAESF